MPKRFQLQVVDVEAIQVTPERVDDAVLWCGGVKVIEKDAINPESTFVAINVPTENDIQRAQEGDYVVKDNYGNFHVVKKDKFETHFKRVDENPEG